jgi:hypothetical protein
MLTMMKRGCALRKCRVALIAIAARYSLAEKMAPATRAGAMFGGMPFSF